MNAKKHRQIILQELQHYIDCAMPGMDKELHSLNLNTKKDFMLDFVEKTSNVRFEVNGKTVSVYNQ